MSDDRIRPIDRDSRVLQRVFDRHRFDAIDGVVGKKYQRLSGDTGH